MKNKLLVCLFSSVMFLSLAACAVSAESESSSEAASETASEALSENTSEAEGAGALPDDLYSFSFEINGNLYQLPMSYTDFISMGWEFDAAEDMTEIPSLSYTFSEPFQMGELEIYGQFFNPGINAASYEDCMISAVSMDSFQYGKAPDTKVIFPKGITMGVSTLDDITAAYGPASDTYEGEMYTKLTYEYDVYQSIEFSVGTESGVLDGFDLENMVVDEEANASAEADVSKDPTEAVLAYKAPEELGDDLYSFVIDFAGDLYQLPAPVSVFLENGWTLHEDSEDIVPGGSFGWAYLRKDNQELRSIARNYDPNAAVIENCFVTSVDANVNGPNLPMTIQKGITLGMSAEELTAALEGTDYTSDDSSDMFTYYTIEGKDSVLDGIEILVNKEENVVTGIEVSYEPDELS